MSKVPLVRMRMRGTPIQGYLRQASFACCARGLLLHESLVAVRQQHGRQLSCVMCGLGQRGQDEPASG